AGVAHQDQGQLVGVTGGPKATGTVTFTLFDPTQTNCVGTPRYTEGRDINTQCTFALATGYSCSTTTGFPADKAGTWQWVATYSGDANNVSVASACGDEPVGVAPASPLVQTAPDPAAGTLNVTQLGDLA